MIIMRIYFISYMAAALKLNGEYLGIIDGVERFVEIPADEKILAEVIPEGQFAPVHFFIGERLFCAPPPFLNVYLLGDEALIYITRYESLDGELKVLSQVQLNGALITQFCVGGKLYVSANGEVCSLYEADNALTNFRLEKAALGGEEVAVLNGGGRLFLISRSGKKLFCGNVLSYKLGDGLDVSISLGGCEKYLAECRYEYFNGELKLTERRVKRQTEAAREVLHFAFFERVLHNCDYAELLHPSLKPKAELLNGYLGKFTGVTVPTNAFYSAHGEGAFCGLIYPVKPKLFTVKYFEVSFDGDLIDNLTECEH